MPEEVTPASATPAPQGGDDLAEIRRLRNEAKKWRLRARDAEAKLAESAQAPPTATAQGARPAAPADDVEDLRGMIERLQADLAARDAALLRQRIASEVELPAALAARLQGEDEAALRADAEALKALLAPAVPAKPGAAPPAAQPQGGVTSVPNGLPATGKSEDQLRQEYLAGGMRSSVPVTQQERSPDGRIVFTSR